MKQLLAHLSGDYLLQSHWEATEKTSRALPAASHAVKYTACFLPLTRNPKALAVIGGTHYVLDRYRLAKQVSWFKNNTFVPERVMYDYDPENNGYPANTPKGLSTALMIITDNTIHMLINAWALKRWSK